ncbi:MAG: ATP-grasp domain-containing protein [Candidatus Bathyarchaeia archaeon]
MKEVGDLNLLIYEHIAGGGFSDDKLQPGILSEGYGMLRALTSDLRAAGCHVTTLLDSRLKALNPPIEADEVIPITSRKQFSEAFKGASGSADVVYVIAPESDGVLRGLVELVEASGGVSLNCRPDTIGSASSKVNVHEVLNGMGLRVPETSVVEVREGVQRIRRVASELGYPLVFKPVDGVGCSGLSVVRDESQIAAAVEKIRGIDGRKSHRPDAGPRGRRQRQCALNRRGGPPHHLERAESLLGAAPLELKLQRGIVPLRHQYEEEALDAARRAVGSFEGLRGYVGVDMVLSKDGPYVIEINPRLTTSYVGLRRVALFNPGEVIIEAVLRRRLPEDTHSSGYASMIKVKVPAPAGESLPEIYGLEDVLSPPFPVTGGEEACALIVSKSDTREDAEMRTRRAELRLLGALRRCRG